MGTTGEMGQTMQSGPADTARAIGGGVDRTGQGVPYPPLPAAHPAMAVNWPRAMRGTPMPLFPMLATIGLLMVALGLWLIVTEASPSPEPAIGLLALGAVAAALGCWLERRATRHGTSQGIGAPSQSDDTAWQPTLPAHAVTQAASPLDVTVAEPPPSAIAKSRVRQAIASDQSLAQAPPPPASAKAAPQWGPHIWRQIEWRRQLAVVTGLFGQAGFRPRAFRPVGLTGADVLLTSDNGQLLLRCVATRAGVSLDDMRGFARSVQARGLPHATYATGGHFSAQARAFARERRIHTLDGEQLLALIATRSPTQQDSLLHVAHAGDYWRPTCMRCGVKLVPRPRASDHRPQWVCRNAPRCTVALPMEMAQLSARGSRPAGG